MAFSISWALSSATIQSSPSIAIVDSDRDDDDDDDEEEDEDEESDILSWRSAIWNTKNLNLLQPNHHRSEKKREKRWKRSILLLELDF